MPEAEVDPRALARHLAAMPGPRRRPHDAAAIARTLEHLRRTFAFHGWTVVEQPCRDQWLGDGLNLIARRLGSEAARVVVAAHHDTVPRSPGADDNGSGLAALLELARLLAAREWEATLDLVAFDFEESNDPAGDRTPSFAGSRAYVEALVRQGIALRGAFVYDLIAYASAEPGSQRVPAGLDRLYPGELAALAQRESRGDFIVAIGLGDARGAELTRAFGAAADGAGLPVLPLGVPAELARRGVAASAFAAPNDLFRSDHISFWAAGLPALFLTDTANFRNPHYHQPSDRPETLDPFFWAKVVAATYAAVASLAVAR